MEQNNSAAADVLGGVLDGLGLSYEHQPPGAYLVRLEGEHKLATMTWLIAGDHSLQVEAFFCRQPDENHAAFYRFLLERSSRMYGVHFALDRTGDVYLTGRLPLAAITEAEIDRLLGCVLSYSDEAFNEALMLGFASAIRREWAWREKRGESLANLRPFAALRPDSDDDVPDEPAVNGLNCAGSTEAGIHVHIHPIAAHTVVCVFFALLTAASNACASVLQRRAAAQVPAERSMHVSLIADLIKRRVWLAGIGMVIVAAVAQAAALATGPIALVQPIFIIELPVTLVLAALANHNRDALRRLPWLAIGTTTAALGLGLAIAQPSGASDSASDQAWIIALIVIAVFEAVLIILATGTIGEAPRGPARAGRRLRLRADRGADQERDGGPRRRGGRILQQLAHLRRRRGRRRVAVPVAERAAGRLPRRLAADAHRRRRADQHRPRRHAIQRGIAGRLVAAPADRRARADHRRLRANREVPARRRSRGTGFGIRVNGTVIV